jgi:hypothetical protein
MTGQCTWQKLAAAKMNERILEPEQYIENSFQRRKQCRTMKKEISMEVVIEKFLE